MLGSLTPCRFNHNSGSAWRQAAPADRWFRPQVSITGRVTYRYQHNAAHVKAWDGLDGTNCRRAGRSDPAYEFEGCNLERGIPPRGIPPRGVYLLRHFFVVFIGGPITTVLVQEEIVQQLINDTDNLDLQQETPQHASEEGEALDQLPTERKLAWLHSADLPANGTAFSTIFAFAHPAPEPDSSVTDATVEGDINATTDVLINSAAGSVTSARTVSVAADVAVSFEADKIHVIDIELGSRADRLAMEQARQAERSFLPPEDIPAFGWYDYFQLGSQLAYHVLCMRRNISPRTVIVEELCAAGSDRPRIRLTATAIAVFARAGMAFNASTQEIVIRQIPRKRKEIAGKATRKPNRTGKAGKLSPTKARPIGSPHANSKTKLLNGASETLSVSMMADRAACRAPSAASSMNALVPTAASPSPTRTRLQWHSFRDQTATKPAAMVPQNDKSRIGHVGSIAVFQALRSNTSLLSLSLQHAGVDDAAMVTLASMLRTNSTLTMLDLTGNHIGRLGIMELCDALEDVPDSSLIDLNLSYNYITDAGMNDICRALRENETLISLDISWNQLSSAALLDFLSAIRDNFVLRSLSIHGKDLDEDQYCTNIESKFGKQIAVALRQVNDSFSLLRLTSSTALIPIDKLKQSRWIDLAGKELTELDVLVVAGLLPLNPKLLTLDLSNNPHVERWAVLEILSNIRHCPTLKDVKLANTGLFAEVAEQVADLVASNQTLETIVMHETALPVQQLRGWKSAFAVESLEFSVAPSHHFDRWILAKCLGVNRIIQQLNGLRLPQAPVQLLREAQGGALCEINWSGRVFDLYEVFFLGKKLLHHLRIGRVALNSCGIDGDGGVALADGVRNHASLLTLELENNSLGLHGGRAMVECVQFNSSLTHLNLSWNKIGNDGAARLDVALAQNHRLMRLDLRGNNLGAIAVVSIARGLEANACLQELHLRWNTICAVGAEALARALATNKCLKLLDIEHHTMGSRGGRAFAEMLAVNSRLEHLNMTGDDAIAEEDRCGIGVEAAELMAKVLSKQNSTLTYLFYGQNRITKDGVVGFNDVLKFNTKLLVLDLSAAELDAKLSQRFFECLGLNKTLVKLDLAHNHIANDGMMACIRALERNKVLRELNVADNWITEEPLALLAAKLQAADKERAITALRWLCLSGNSMTERTRAAFLGLPSSRIAIELEVEVRQYL